MWKMTRCTSFYKELECGRVAGAGSESALVETITDAKEPDPHELVAGYLAPSCYCHIRRRGCRCGLLSHSTLYGSSHEAGSG